MDVHPVMRIGLGTLHSPADGWGLTANPTEATAVIQSAIALGIRLFDTAWYYGPDVANRLLARGISPYRDDLIIIGKVGNTRTQTRAYRPEVDPAALRSACHRTLRTLEIEQIPLLLLRWRADLGLTETFDGAWDMILQLQREGKAKHVGLSNVAINHIRRAGTRGHVAAVSNAYSLFDRSDEHVLRYCDQERIWFLPYYPLNRGSVRNDDELAEVAAQLDASPAQVALAWLVQQSPMVVPIPGTSRSDHLVENVRALDLLLSEDQCARLSRLRR